MEACLVAKECCWRGVLGCLAFDSAQSFASINLCVEYLNPIPNQASQEARDGQRSGAEKKVSVSKLVRRNGR
jgi:hypothetical protein